MQESVRVSSDTASSGAQPRFVIIQPGVVSRTFWLLRRAFMAAYEDNCFGIAKGAAYSLLLSLFPILTTLTAILLQANAQSVVHVIAAFVREIVPPGTEDLVLSRLRERGARPISLPVISVVLSLWAGSGAMISLMEGFEAAYRIPSSRLFLKQRGMAALLVIVAALPWIGVSEISAPVEIAWRIARYVLAICTTVFVTGLLYYFGPSHRPEQRLLREVSSSRFLRVWPGAFVATVLWLLATAGFAWYVAHLANYNIFYGSIGTVIILLIWLYLIACIALIGCEFNAERERIDSIPFLQ